MGTISIICLQDNHLQYSHFQLNKMCIFLSSKSPVEDASHACKIDLGILHCPLTCGYCSPFEYESLKRFAKPQLTLLPSVIYQTRLKEAECHGFAAVVQNQNLGE